MQGGLFEYRLIAEAIPQMVWISDPLGRAEYFNARWFDYTGLTPEACAGDGWAQAVHPDDLPRVVATRTVTLESGEMFDTEFRVRRADAVYRWFLVRALPMRDDEGRIAGWMGTCTDIDEQKRAELQLRFLLEAGRTLSASLDPAGIARDLARMIVPQLADYCQVFGIEHGTLRALAIEHRSPAKAAILREIDERFPLSLEAPAIARFLTSAEPVAIPEVTDAMREMSARGPEHLALLKEVGARSSIVVPLVANDVPLGLLGMVYTDSGRRYGAGDVNVVREIGRRLSAALVNALNYQRERHIANTLQTAMLPERLPAVPGARLHKLYQPGESTLQVGGDWFDAFELPDGTLGLSIGDVTGHGLQAAVVMGEIRQAIRSAAIENAPPSRVLDHADRALRLGHPDTIATAGFGIYDPRTRILRYAQAGHPLPLCLAPGREVEDISAHGLPLGMRDLGATDETERSLVPGELVVFYTDGLVEFDRDMERGESALRAAMREELADPSANPALSIFRRVHTRAALFGDDTAILTLQVE